MEEKIELIKQIVKHHPSYGTDKGWSTYVGGMADTGHWFWEKLIEVDNHRLEVFLVFLQKEKAIQDKYLDEQRMEMERVKSLALYDQAEYRINKLREEYEKRHEFVNGIEYKLLWGK